MPNPERVELVRLRLGLTKTGFAEKLGVDRKTMQRFEKSGELSKDILDRLCSITGYQEAFFDKSDAEYPNTTLQSGATASAGAPITVRHRCPRRRAAKRMPPPWNPARPAPS